MNATAERTIAELVTEKPARSKVFERHGIDFCCGGKKRLAEVCASRGLATETIVEELLTLDAPAGEIDPSALSLPELIDHIVATHHVPLVMELPRLTRMAARVAKVHGEHDARLEQIAAAVLGLWDEMTVHMAKEEQVIFPSIRALADPNRPQRTPRELLSDAIGALELEHDGAGDALGRVRALSDNYTPPDWACNTYRALLDGLHELELDLHTHVHKENNILFPKALELEALVH